MNSLEINLETVRGKQSGAVFGGRGGGGVNLIPALEQMTGSKNWVVEGGNGIRGKEAQY